MKFSVLVAYVLLLAVAGCTHTPDTSKEGVEVPNPDSVTDFATLYSQNCAGCHGDNGQHGAAFDLSNPVYQGWIDDAALTKIIANGEPGTQMPAFAKSAGGFLTDGQVVALVRGMRSSWQKPDALNGTPPPYTTSLTGDVVRGQQVYRAQCAVCHRRPSMSITNATYLALVNDQTLRTIVISGRPDIGMPDWEKHAPGHVLSDQEVTDVVAWLASQRSQTPGQPYSQP